jgi:hypothetical protein
MQSQININIAVNVTKALSEQTLADNIYMMDDSLLGSACQGTAELVTACQPGQTVRWMVYAIDLQTFVAIKNISFCHAVLSDLPETAAAEANEWIGVLPLMEQGRKYTYRIALQMGKGIQGCLAIDTPSLKYTQK